MESTADSPYGGQPAPRMVVNQARLIGRNLCFALGLWVAVGAYGGSWALGGLLASVLWLLMLLERRLLLREVSGTMQSACASAQIEGQRDAIAQVMSLELSYERLRSVLEALGEGVLVLDEVGEIVIANPKARAVLAVGSTEPMGRVLWEVLPAELATRAREAFEAVQRSSQHEDELPLVRYSGIACSDRVYDLTAVQATSRRTGQEFGTVLLLVDSTRTHELQRIKDQFLSNVSHELRTPLTNICAYSEILRQMLPGDSSEWPEFVRVINQEGVRLSSLVDGMFDFLQLESGEAVFDEVSLDGVEVVREVVARRHPEAHQRGIAVDVVVDDGAPPLFVDRQRLEQVVRSLLENAIKFTPDHGRVAVAVRGRDGGWELRIEDTGPGVPKGYRDAVFEKFHQLQDQLTEKPQGTGIGLATSRAIVARFGGLIWCEDSEMGGASFVVLLPGEGQPKLASFGAGTGAGGGF
jgi:signal transduction histidine kinase